MDNQPMEERTFKASIKRKNEAYELALKRVVELAGTMLSPNIAGTAEFLATFQISKNSDKPFFEQLEGLLKSSVTPHDKKTFDLGNNTKLTLGYAGTFADSKEANSIVVSAEITLSSYSFKSGFNAEDLKEIYKYIPEMKNGSSSKDLFQLSTYELKEVIQDPLTRSMSEKKKKRSKKDGSTSPSCP